MTYPNCVYDYNKNKDNACVAVLVLTYIISLNTQSQWTKSIFFIPLLTLAMTSQLIFSAMQKSHGNPVSWHKKWPLTKEKLDEFNSETNDFEVIKVFFSFSLIFCILEIELNFFSFGRHSIEGWDRFLNSKIGFSGNEIFVMCIDFVLIINCNSDQSNSIAYIHKAYVFTVQSLE